MRSATDWSVGGGGIDSREEIDLWLLQVCQLRNSHVTKKSAY